jgi:head-tail adaptor
MTGKIILDEWTQPPAVYREVMARETNFPHRHRVTIQRRTSSRNSVGEVLYGFEDAFTSWAELRDDVCTIRYHQAEIELGWRVVIGGHHFYEITGIVDRKFRGGRLVDLHMKPVSNTGRGRDYPPRFDGGEQSQGFQRISG